MISFSLNIQCTLCHETFKPNLNQTICDRCIKLLPIIEHGCTHCGMAIDKTESYCTHCKKKRYLFDKLLACFEYQYPIRHMIQRYKYNQSFPLGELMTQFSVIHIQDAYRNDTLPELLVPVPLHKAKQKQRGYNQALEIAKIFSRELKINLENRLQKTVATESQSMLPFKERQKNIRNSFIFKTGSEKHIALIDDVATTCATVSEIAKVMKQTHVKRVDVWCLARTGM